ncbi:hypothetical protein FB599_0376 [Herbaspirillum sp. SJZ130]|nr:hypothetical protein FB599_0376 [Herbaspirillum sp. SJZ130]TQK14973.1 hypothetical protein FB598_0314 [Herbaspirillum sp. SJZ106]TWC67328.1 hypothetical protein FB597_104138 [Herbaspirillum sp. SJZ099]
MDLPPSADFLDWWFAPWSYARRHAAPPCAGTLGARDAYRDWCRQAAVDPVLPVAGDLRWQMTVRDGDEFGRAAELFGGLFAARARNHDELAALSPARRRWCLSVALTQPLLAWTGELPQALATARARGLLEAAMRLEHALPGMWSRLRLLLPDDEAGQLGRRLALGTPESARLRERERNCWQLCLAQARGAGA